MLRLRFALPFGVLPLLLVVVFALSGCFPYAVGTTAATVAPGEVVPTATFQFVSDRRELEETPDGEPANGAYASLDNEVRFGLTDASDMGVRLVGASGIVASYKRRLAGEGDAGLAFIGGAGLVGFGTHLHAEGTLVASAPRGTLTPYGGVRAQHAFPFASDAASLDPAIGAFAGVRFGWRDLGVSPELGVFYSPSPYLDNRDVIVVPSITVHGDRLLQALGM